MVQLSHPYMTTRRIIALTRWTFVGKVMSLLFNTLSRFIIAFLPRSKSLLISWSLSPSAVILETRNINSVTASTFSPSICRKQWAPFYLSVTGWIIMLRLSNDYTAGSNFKRPAWKFPAGVTMIACPLFPKEENVGSQGQKHWISVLIYSQNIGPWTPTVKSLRGHFGKEGNSELTWDWVEATKSLNLLSLISFVCLLYSVLLFQKNKFPFA